MKTTVELSDELLTRAKAAAHREETTLRALIEEGLRIILEQRAEQRKSYQWPDLSFGGEGLQEGIEEGNWTRIRDLIYEGRGA